MATVNNTPKYGRAADKIEGIGPNLEVIQGRDIILRGVSIDERAMKGETQVFCKIVYTEVGGDEILSVHAWSPSLAEKLLQLRPAEMEADLPCLFLLDEPQLAKFVKVQTGSGFRVWSIE